MTAIFAHRGASTVAAENTIEAFSQAISLGADGIELDVQRTQDGVIVVCHDETLNRTSNGFGKLADMTYAELTKLDFTAGEDFKDKPWYASSAKIPTLVEVLELIKPTSLALNIELKNSEEPYPGMENQVVQLVIEAKLADRVIYSSFNHDSIKLLSELGVQSELALLTNWFFPKATQRVKEAGATGLHPTIKVPTFSRTAKKCVEEKIAVRAWTPDSITDLKRCFELGVDAVITNEVSRALDVRKLVLG